MRQHAKALGCDERQPRVVALERCAEAVLLCLVRRLTQVRQRAAVACLALIGQVARRQQRCECHGWRQVWWAAHRPRCGVRLGRRGGRHEACAARRHGARVRGLDATRRHTHVARDKRVVQELHGRGARARVTLQAAAHKVRQVHANVRARLRQRQRRAVVLQQVEQPPVAARRVQRVAAQRDGQQREPKRPDVGRVAVRQPGDALGRHVRHGAHKRARQPVAAAVTDCQGRRQRWQNGDSGVAGTARRGTPAIKTAAAAAADNAGGVVGRVAHDAKVGQFHLAEVVDEQVGGLDVAVDEPARVHEREAVQRAVRNVGQHRLGLDAAAGHDLLE